MLSNMRPCLAPLDIADNRLVNPIFSGNDVLWPRVYADWGYLFGLQFGGATALTARHFARHPSAPMLIAPFNTIRFNDMHIPPSMHHIRSVFGLRSDAQMRGVDAWWVITRMKSAKVGRLAAIKRERNAVGAEISVNNMERPVSIVIGAGSPVPAIIGPAHINLRPKARYVFRGHFWYIFSHGLHSVLRSVLERWKRCQHTDNSLSLVAWQGGAL